MSKLTCKKIVNILESFCNPSEWANQEWAVHEDFEPSESAMLAKATKDATYKAWTSHPGYGNSDKADEKYETLRRAWLDTPDYEPVVSDEYLVFLGVGVVECVEDFGGEGQGDTRYVITYFKEHDVYLRTEGWYSSYEGSTFDDGFGREVRPKKKTITVYE